jgi:hypothetical protein
MAFKTNGSGGTKKAVSAVENSDKLWKDLGTVCPELAAKPSGAGICWNERVLAECRPGDRRKVENPGSIQTGLGMHVGNPAA